MNPSTTRDFIESVPTGVPTLLSDHAIRENKFTKDGKDAVVSIPPVTLHCGNPVCNGPHLFDASPGSIQIQQPNDLMHVFLEFTCRHCRTTKKTVAVRLFRTEKGCTALKIGELPPFGAPLSARLLQLAGEYGSLLRKGRQCENHGLGVGAFAYYRRVVEAQKHRLIDELEKAFKRLGAGEEVAAALDVARRENQFTKAIETIAAVIPKELFVAGQNPLTLLHGPLSIGLHQSTDEECLKNAHHIRVVMTALLERMATMTEASAELDASVKELLEAKAQR